MLVAKILKKDFLRKRSITIVEFVFIFLSAWLVASGANLIVELSNSLTSLFASAQVPHFVQMHAGEIDQAAIDRWSAANNLVQAQQTVAMITIDGSSLYLADSQTSEENGIMDISFVQQNQSFDFLLDLENQIVRLAPGEIAVPIYYMQQNHLKIGDNVRLSSASFEKTFTIAAFARDAQMNPAIIHSKRFLVNEGDYALVAEHFPEKEYLIEFLLTNPGQIGEFSDDYLAAGLPQKGPTVSLLVFQIYTALTDGVVAGVVIVLSLLLMVIAILCLRFTILATIEEDYKEIGVMKAIGIAQADIRRIYLSKYLLLGVLSSLLGYSASLLCGRYFSANISLYLGSAPKGLVQFAIPLVAASAVSGMVVLSCLVVLRRFKRITAVEALRSGSVGEWVMNMKFLRLGQMRIPDVNIFLGLRDVVQRFKVFGLLCFVFFFCVCIILVPIHFLTTMTSPTFITYMGIGKSDLRIDLRQSDDIVGRYKRMAAYLAADVDVERFSPLVTSQYKRLQDNGEMEMINIETGDFSLFPLDYLEGAAPQNENEIALSSLNSQDMDKRVGDPLVLIVNGQEKTLVICGIYQDVTNGGRTAKAMLPYDPNSVLWYTVSLDLKPTAGMEKKVQEYAAAFYPARITDIEGYIAQTLGNTIDQLRKVTLVAVAVGVLVSMLITSLFLKMLIARDSSQIAIMRSLGFSLHDIRVQYLTKALLLLGIGILLGTLFSNTVGQRLVGVLWSLMGAAEIRFVIDPFQAYIFFPLLLMLAVAITTFANLAGIQETSIIRMIVE